MEPSDIKPPYDPTKIDLEWIAQTNSIEELKAAYKSLIDDPRDSPDLEITLKTKIENLSKDLQETYSIPPSNSSAPEEIKTLERNPDNLTSEIQAEEKKESDSNEANSEKAKQDGNAFLKAKDYSQAVSSYTRAIALNPQNAAAYYNRALVHIKQKNLKEAVEDCSKAILLKENYAKAYHRRAQAFIELKEHRNAILDLEKVLQLQPENKDANAEMKKCREEFDSQIASPIKTEEAETQVPKINITEDSPLEVNEKSESLTEEAVEPLKLHPPASPRHIIVDEAEFIESLQQEEALEIILENNNTEEFIANVEAVKVEGNKFFKAEEFDSAITEFTKGIASIEKYYDEEKILLDAKLFQLTLKLYNNRALAYSKLDLNNEAIQDSLKVLKIDMNNAKALYRMAKCQACRNNYKEAAKSMKKLLKIDPLNEEAKKDYESYVKKAGDSRKSSESYINAERERKRKASVEEKEKSLENFERRVSFREDNPSSKDETKPSLMKKLSFKSAEAKFPKNNEDDYQDDLEPDEEEEQAQSSLFAKLRDIDKPRSKKPVAADFSEELINNPEDAEFEPISLEQSKRYLIFEATAKSLQQDPGAFYEYLKTVPIEEIPVIFENNEFSAELIIQCVQSIEDRELDVHWTSRFFHAISITNRFSAVIELLSLPEKARLKNLFEKLGNAELVQAFKLN